MAVLTIQVLRARDVQLIDETPRLGLTGKIACVHPSAITGSDLVHGPNAFRHSRI